MPRLWPVMLVLPALVPAAAPAQPPPAPAPRAPAPREGGGAGMDYSVIAAGLSVAILRADFFITPASYRVHLAYRTAGLVGALLHGAMDTTAEGGWRDDAPVPMQFYSWGDFRGQLRRTLIDFVNGEPEIRDLTPPNTTEREPVPPDMIGGSIDTLSAMALLIHQIEDTGRCEAAATTFDGRRLVRISATTAGEQVLAPAGGSHFAGEALRCDFAAQQVAGFLRDNDDFAHRPHHGSAWFARVVPDGPPVPVRISFETRWFGDAIAYLRQAQPETPRP